MMQIYRTVDTRSIPNFFVTGNMSHGGGYGNQGYSGPNMGGGNMMGGGGNRRY